MIVGVVIMLLYYCCCAASLCDPYKESMPDFLPDSGLSFVTPLGESPEASNIGINI